MALSPARSRERCWPGYLAWLSGTALLLVPSFLVLGIVFVAGVMVSPVLLSQLGEMSGRPRLQMLLALFGTGVGLVIKGTLIYSVFFLWASGGRVFAAIGKSVKHARTWPWLTGLIVLTPWMIQGPIDLLISRSNTLWSGTGSELVFLLQTT